MAAPIACRCCGEAGKKMGPAPRYGTLCLDCYRAARRRWRANASPETRERQLDAAREWRRRNPAKARAAVRQWKSKNPAAAAEICRFSRIKRKYGLSRESYADLLRAQGGRCAICGSPIGSRVVSCVDHDHETGRVRGLLCPPCNKGIGMLGDDPERLIRAAEYLCLPVPAARSMS